MFRRGWSGLEWGGVGCGGGMMVWYNKDLSDKTCPRAIDMENMKIYHIIYIYMYTYIYACIYIYTYMYIYIYVTRIILAYYHQLVCAQRMLIL